MGSLRSPKAEAEVPAFAQGQVSGIQQQIEGLNIPQFQLSPLEQQAQSFGSSFFGQGGLLPQQQRLLSQTLGGQFLTPTNNPFLQQTLNLQEQRFKQGLSQGLNQLTSAFGLAGQGATSSGALAGQGRLLTERSLDQFGRNVGDILSQNFGRERGFQQQAISLTGQPIQQALALGGLGGLQRNIQQQQLTADQIPIGLLLSLLNATPFAFPQFGASPFSQNVGAISGGVQGLGGLLSGIGAVK